MSPYGFVYILLTLFTAVWFRQANKRLLKLSIIGLIYAICGYFFVLAVCDPEYMRCALLKRKWDEFILSNLIIFLFWTYVLYFVRYIVKLAKRQETLPKISISGIKEKLQSAIGMLKSFAAKAKSMAQKAGATNILLTLIAVLLLLIVAKVYRW